MPTGQEAITCNLMDTIEISELAQSHYRQRTRHTGAAVTPPHDEYSLMPQSVTMLNCRHRGRASIRWEKVALSPRQT